MTGVRDETWLRLVDVPRALAARSYEAAPGSLVIAGRVTQHRHGALAAADRLFATPRAPFAGTSF